jgi:PAS domain S-box-containing protein
MKDKYKWFFDQSPFMIVILDEHGIVKNINQKVFDWLGYSPDTFIGERFISLKELSGEIEEPLNEKSKTPIEISFLSSDKTIKKGQIFSIATPDKNTTILYIQNDTFFKKEENVAGFQYRRALLSLFNSPANTIVILNRKFKIVRINDHTLNLLERDRVDILGRDIFSFVKIEKSQLSKIISSQESILQYETFVYAGKRKQIPVLIKISKLLQNDEVFIVLDIFNISDRIAMERELRENKEKFRQLTENNDEAFWISTAEDIEHIAYVSPAFEHIWGISPEKLYKHPYVWKKSIYHEDKDFVEAELHSFSKYQKKLNIKYRILHKDGTIRWVWNKGFLIQSTPGAKPCFAGIIQDITLQRYTEEALRESSKKYKSLFELVSDSLLIVHEQTLQIIDANMAACNMFSYEYGDLLGEKITKLTREKRKIKQI